MVGVRAHLDYRIPCLIPREEILVDEYSHKLGDTKSGMGVVNMDSNLIRKIIKSSVNCHMVADYALAGCGNKEILLRKSEKLTLDMVIGGIQHLGNDLCIGAFLNCLGVLSLSEELHIEVMDISCLPKTELAYCLTVRS